LFAFVAHEILLSQDEFSELNHLSSFGDPPQSELASLRLQYHSRDDEICENMSSVKFAFLVDANGRT
jgi:predicted alpha/beta hydrolase family esterase